MKYFISSAAFFLAAAKAFAAEPLKLHPANPHYFLIRGKPTVLIGSGEHYGAVLNQDFDYLAYLDTLKAEGMNLIRTVPATSLESTNAVTGVGGCRLLHRDFGNAFLHVLRATPDYVTQPSTCWRGAAAPGWRLKPVSV